MNRDLENNVHQWLHVDNNIKQLTAQLKDLKEQKNELEGNITNYAEMNKINNLSIKTDEGILKIAETTSTSQLTFKYLEKCLNEIINDNNQVNNIINYIKEKREKTRNKGIKRFSL